MVLNSTKKHCFFSPKLVGNEIFHRVIGEELFKFSVQLGCQCLVMCYDKSWLLQLLDDIRHGECLARSSNAKQCLALISFLKSFHQ